jgi:hypothetical protein
MIAYRLPYTGSKVVAYRIVEAVVLIFEQFLVLTSVDTRSPDEVGIVTASQDQGIWKNDR